MRPCPGPFLHVSWLGSSLDNCFGDRQERLGRMQVAHVRRGFALSFVAALAVMGLFPSPAYANGIGPEFAMRWGSLGLVALAAVMAFIVLVEGGVVAAGLGLGPGPAYRLVLVANLVSLLAGLPVWSFNRYVAQRFLAPGFGLHYSKHVGTILVGAAAYFVASIVLEFVVVALWVRRRQGSGRQGRVAAFVVIANVITYAVLVPLRYYWAVNQRW